MKADKYQGMHACPFLPEYEEGKDNGILCPTKDYMKKCEKCGFNPKVAKNRLMMRINTQGHFKVTEQYTQYLISISFRNSWFNPHNELYEDAHARWRECSDD